MKLVVMLFLFILTACAAGESLPPIQGPWVQLNTTMWTPTPVEAQAIKDLPER